MVSFVSPIPTEYPLPKGGVITHPALVAALAKPGADILDTLTPQKVDAWHMASCIPGEAGELFDPLNRSMNFGAPLDRENVVEELGDIEFYVQGLRTNLNIPAASVRSHGKSAGDCMSYMGLPGRAADVFDAVKKWVLYNKPIDMVKVGDALYGLDVILHAIRDSLGITYDEVLAANVMKLGTRYDGLSYSDAAAQLRADKTVH